MSMVNPTPFYQVTVLYVEGKTDSYFFDTLSRKKFKCKLLVEDFYRSNKVRIINHIANKQDPHEYGVVDKDFEYGFEKEDTIVMKPVEKETKKKNTKKKK